MFHALLKRWHHPPATTNLQPLLPPRGAPVLDPERCSIDGACARTCPSAAITLTPHPEGYAEWQIDYGACVFCGRCEAACGPRAITLTSERNLATRIRKDLVCVETVTEPRLRRPPAPGEVRAR